MKQSMRAFNSSSLTKYGDKQLVEFSLDKTLAQAYEKNVFGNNVYKGDLEKEVIPHIQSLSRQLERQNTLEINKQQMTIQKNKGLDLSR